MTLLQKLVNVFKDNLNINDISIIMRYLLGDELNTSCTFSEQSLYNIFNEKSTLSKEHFDILMYSSSKNWNFEYLPSSLRRKNSLETNLKHFAEENNIKTEKNISLTVSSIVFHYFFGTFDTSILFPYEQRRLINKYIPWSKMEDKIIRSLEDKNILFLSGNPGTGKTQILINTLKKYTTPYPDIFWLDSFDNDILPIEEKLLKISFIDQESSTLTLDKIFHNLNDKPTTSVLVIEIPYISDSDIAFIEKNFTHMNLRVIIVTLYCNHKLNYPILDLNNRPIEQLSNIAYSYPSLSNFEKKELNQLLENIDYNPYVLTLIAKGLSKSLTKDIVLKKDTWIWNETITCKFHSSYPNSQDKSSQTIFNLIGRLLHHYPQDFLDAYASELSIWAKVPISRNLIEKHFPPESIDQALTYGILQYYDNEHLKIYMPHLIADIIWKRYPIRYNIYKDKIYDLLHNLEYGKPLSIPYTELYQIIFNIILRFYFQVTTIPSRMKKKSKIILDQTIGNWNNLLIDITERYMKLGNYQYAQHIFPYLFVSHNTKGEIFPPSTLQIGIKKLLKLQTDYMKSENIIPNLDNIIIFIKDIEKDIEGKYNLSEHEIQILQKLCSLILEDMVNCIIDTSLVIIAQKSAEKYHSFLRRLNELSAILNSYNYYHSLLLEFIYHYTLAIFDPYYASFHLEEGRKYKDTLLYKDSASCEEIFQVKGLCLYFNTVLLCDEVYNLDIVKVLESEYNDLYTMFTNSIWSYHPSYIFYSCTFLLATRLLPHFYQLCTYKHLKDSMKQCKTFNRAQLSLPSYKADTYDILIESKITELNEYMSHRENFL